MANSTHSTSSATGVAVGASLAVIFLLVAGGVLVLVLRRRRRPFKQLHESEGGKGRASVVLDRAHPASRVTPFTPGRAEDVPRFTRTPGEDMRIARRRSDGGWEFSNPVPSLTDLQAPPARESLFTHSRTASACSSPTTSSITLVGAGGKGGKDKKLPGELTTRGFVEIYDTTTDSILEAPPAYTPQRSASRNSHSYSQSTHF